MTDGLGNDLRAAPIRRRFAAGLIDLIVLLLGFAISVGVYRHLDPARSGLVKRTGRSVSKIVGSRKAKLAARLVSFVLTVLLTGRRGPGARILHIRLLDARTGAPVSKRQALIRVSVREAWQILTHRLLPSPADQPPRVTTETRPAPEVIQSPSVEAQQGLPTQEMRTVRQTQTIRLLWGRIVGRIALANVIHIPILWTQARQGLPDILAGTAVLLDDRKAIGEP